MRSIVIFYSLDGNTKKAAKNISTKLGAEVLELETVWTIPRKGIGKFIIGGAQATFRFCPKLKSFTFEADSYERIIIGTPVWAGKYVPAIRSFLKECEIAEKVEAVFTVSGGGDNDGCLEEIRKLIPNIKWSTSLIDCSNPASSDNDSKIDCFVEEIIDGK